MAAYVADPRVHFDQNFGGWQVNGDRYNWYKTQAAAIAAIKNPPPRKPVEHIDFRVDWNAKTNVLAPKKTAAMIEQDKKSAAAREVVRLKAVEQQRLDAVNKLTVKHHLAEKARIAEHNRMMALPGPAGDAYRKHQWDIRHPDSGGLFGFIEDAANGIAKGLGSVVKGAATFSGKIGDALGKVPFVGAGLAGVYDLATANGVLQIASHVVEGDRLDQVALQGLKAHVGAVQAVAPYAQTVLSFVPLVGPGLNAGLSIGLALAAGQKITEAVAAGVKAALPGGPLAAAAFELARGVMAGRRIDDLALAALPIDAKAKRAISAGLDAARRIAKGERVDKALLAQATTAIALLPKEARTALQAGIAIGSGQVLQAAAALSQVPGAEAAKKVVEDNVKIKLPKLKLKLPKLAAPKLPALPKLSTKSYSRAIGSVLKSQPKPKVPLKLPTMARAPVATVQKKTFAALAKAAVVASVKPKAAIGHAAAPKKPVIAATLKKKAAMFPVSAALLKRPTQLAIKPGSKPLTMVSLLGKQPAVKPPVAAAVLLGAKPPVAAAPKVLAKGSIRTGWFIPLEGPGANRIDFSKTRWAPAA
jgi:hypothetical protein